jgi:hypothetical protein
LAYRLRMKVRGPALVAVVVSLIALLAPATISRG